MVKTVRQKLNDDRKQTVLKHEWETGLILISSKAKATGSTPVIMQLLCTLFSTFSIPWISASTQHLAFLKQLRA